jgi:hypothetical protein
MPRLLLNTALYIASVATVMAAALNPAGTAALLRRQTVRLGAAVRTVSNNAHEPVVAASEIKARPSPAQAKSRGARPGEYRVAIGTPIPARLRTPIDSGTARVNDQVDAILTSPVTQDGVELIPAGSTLHGRIVQADSATKKAPLGRIDMVFTVVQHADTHSRAAIRTHTFTAEAEAPAEITGMRTPKRQPIDVALAAGHPIVLTLSEPLLVYIPNAR